MQLLHHLFEDNMASLLRVVLRRGGRMLAVNSTSPTKFLQPACFISTSKKNKDAATFTDTSATSSAEEKLDEKEEVDYARLGNWDSSDFLVCLRLHYRLLFIQLLTITYLSDRLV